MYSMIFTSPQHLALKKAFDSLPASTFTASSFPTWGWCGDYVKAVRWNQVSHQRACRSELWLRLGDTCWTVPQKHISSWSHLALFSWSRHIASQQRQMCWMRDRGARKYVQHVIDFSLTVCKRHWLIHTDHGCYKETEVFLSSQL